MQRAESQELEFNPSVPIKKRPGEIIQQDSPNIFEKRLHSAKGKWVDEFTGVLCVYRTTNRNPIRVLSFALTYGMEAIIPKKIRMPTLQTKIPEKASVEAVTEELDMTNELREVAAVLIVSYHERLKNLYNRRIKSRTFRDGDLVLRRIFVNTANPADRKFQQNWERSCTVVRVGVARSFA